MMGQVSGYTLDLYCDRENPAHAYQEFPQEYLDPERGAPCRRAARKDGWFLGKTLTLCPKCNPRSKKYVPATGATDGSSND
jgi:hypothetical protein